ncbi:hypothetical protein [Kitasatospora sp. NPDC091207]|uniref:hypothetical protein n=1 Tax=Kitasatospora sp. NPDC091207 TaxID=3364083 RepID=UPI003822D0F5
MTRTKRLAAAAASVAVAALIPLTAAPAHAATGPATHNGLTWQVVATGPQGTVEVGGGSAADPYHGDTPASATLPVLCLGVDDSPAPAGITVGFFSGWAQGTLAVSRPVKGERLNSRAAADTVCQATFGIGWRQAEFHDGHYGPDLALTGGWNFWGYGNLPTDTRFWIAIDTLPANPWN